MILGFTGTREGLTTQQLQAFAKVVAELPPFTEFHHGACIGEDSDAVTHIRFGQIVLGKQKAEAL